MSVESMDKSNEVDINQPISTSIPVVAFDEPSPTPYPSEYWNPRLTKRPPAWVKCEIKDLVQYDCMLSSHKVICKPLIRWFRMCEGYPSVEVTGRPKEMDLI